MRLISLLFILRTAGARPVLLGLGPYQLQLQIPLLEEKTHTDSNNAVEMVSAPSIGLHFTTSYAMASAHFVNGTTTDLFKMEADAGYTKLLSHWMDVYAEEAGTHAQSPSSSPSPPPTTTATNSNNTNLETPATILTPFLSKLHGAITHFEQSNGPITHLTPAIFPLTTSHEAVFRSALTRAGLVTSESEAEAVQPLLRDSDAAYAGLERAAPYSRPGDYEKRGAASTCARGACGNAQQQQQQRRRRQQQRQQKQQQEQHMLFLSFDNTSFSAGMVSHPSEPSSSLSQQHLSYTASSKLGWYSLPVFHTPRAAFWLKMQDAIVSVVGAGGKPPGRIVIMGERGSDAEFRKVVEDAVWRAWEVDVGIMLGGHHDDDGNGEWAVARGAARVGWIGGV